MKKSWTKNLMMHIRYPWTAFCLLILWVGLAIMCTILQFSVEDLMILISVAGFATLIVALVGFQG